MTVAASKALRVLLLTDEAVVPDKPRRQLEGRDAELSKTEYDVLAALKKLGHEVTCAGVGSDLSVIGHAIDARGLPCQDLACPRCHLIVPDVMLTAEPFFISILGTPGCGKSFYLAALTWELPHFRRACAQRCRPHPRTPPTRSQALSPSCLAAGPRGSLTRIRRCATSMRWSTDCEL